MQNPGDDECAQPVPRFYVTLRDAAAGIGPPPTRELLRISIVSKKERRGGSTCYGIAEGLFACLARLPAFDASFRLIAKTTSSSERGRH